jgi:diguanylate cyclase (GGDEF)-like protein
MIRSKHDPTDRRLSHLVGLVVLAALVALAASTYLAASRGRPGWGTVAALVFLMVVARLPSVRVRIRATHHAIGWTEAGTLIALTVAPPAWVVLCVAAGVGAVVLARRQPPLKASFGVAKDVIVASVGAALVGALTAAPTQRPLHDLVPLAVGYLVMNLVDEVVTVPVIAIASRTGIRERLLAHLDLRLLFIVARFGVVVAALAFLEVNRGLLLAVPPLVLSLHFWHSSRIRVRAEQQAWRQLAAATDGVTQVDLSAVLHTATREASTLFSADLIEVELRSGGRARLVRGDGDTVRYDGPPGQAPAEDTVAVTVPLDGAGLAEAIGELRLRFRGTVRLQEREQYTLKTFAAALFTAVRNATAYAELQRVATEHAHAAAHDALTGLPNRRQLLDQAQELLGRGHPAGVTALALIDLNHFKEINDRLGHVAGDKVLIEIAERLRSTAGPALVARLGGDEFAVLFTGLPAPALAIRNAESLLAALSAVMELDGMRITVEASAGVAVAPGSGDVGELLRRADVAMYHAKRSGQRVAAYAQARDTADIGGLALAGDLPRALAEHEFIVNFQPIVDLATGQVIAAEALTRWRHPELGELEPGRFLPAVERSVLLPAFADTVLDQALAAAITWRAAGYDLPVAVNVSPRSLLDARFPASIAAGLRAHGLPADQLFLELTETLTISQLEVVDRVLSRLREQGVQLALDDFGTGYSSLSVLSRVTVNEIKVDREFVAAMDTSTEARAVVRSTVELARNLGLTVVAEGVESESQRKALWEMGCNAGQGHLFARPMSSARMLATMRRGVAGRPGTVAHALHESAAVVRILDRRPASLATGEPGRPERQA